MPHSRWVLGSLLAVAACRAHPAASEAVAPPGPAEPLATQPFRDEHAEIWVHLEHVRAAVGRLPGETPATARESLAAIVAFFSDHIGPHARAEERALYPAVDAHVGGARPFTASMRHEHEIVARWIAELEAEAAQAEPDLVAFARRADNLLGLLAAHFEEEERVLLPILDRSMTPERFRREVLERSHSESSR
jgi:hemerythrin-like domain-containing protein